MTRRGAWTAGMLVMVVLAAGAATAIGAAAGQASSDLPEAVAAALKTAFPAAVIKAAELEDEQAVTLYVVRLEQGKETIDVELSGEGVIGEERVGRWVVGIREGLAHWLLRIGCRHRSLGRGRR